MLENIPSQGGLEAEEQHDMPSCMGAVPWEAVGLRFTQVFGTVSNYAIRTSRSSSYLSQFLAKDAALECYNPMNVIR